MPLYSTVLIEKGEAILLKHMLYCIVIPFFRQPGQFKLIAKCMQDPTNCNVCGRKLIKKQKSIHRNIMTS